MELFGSESKGGYGRSDCCCGGGSDSTLPLLLAALGAAVWFLNMVITYLIILKE